MMTSVPEFGGGVATGWATTAVADSARNSAARASRFIFDPWLPDSAVNGRSGPEGLGTLSHGPSAASVLRLIDEPVRLDPRHHGSQLLPDLFDRVLGHQAAPRIQRCCPGAVLEDEPFRVLAVLDAGKYAFNGLLGL